MEPISFETHPDRYHHIDLEIDGDVATLTIDIEESAPLRPGYTLKLNSYDLGVDIELADAVERLRFEHPEVRAVVVRSGKDRVFSAGANIPMLATSAHGFKVNFCKFTNETRLGIEDACRAGTQGWVAALAGTCAGGGYELALACDRIVLIDDGSSAVSLPEVPLLGVLPGTGGLTRVVDKRKVRRDLADVFCTTAEGVKGRRAVEWNLVDATAPRSKFDEVVGQHARELVDTTRARTGPGIELDPLEPEVTDDAIRYRHVEVQIDRTARTARIIVTGPDGNVISTAEEAHAQGSSWWPLRAFRELDDAILNLRFNEPTVGVIRLETRGDVDAILELDAALVRLRDDWFVREVLLKMARVLRRLDQTARSFFAVIDAGSCFAGTLCELALLADRSYMLDDPDNPVVVALSEMNAGALPMAHGLTRLQAHLIAEPALADEALARKTPFAPEEAKAAGLVTIVADDIDFLDELRIAIEERAHMSPDALTGMEASLRFPGAETMESKVFGRLSAWQNWIFQRPNAVGERGALTMYGEPEQPSFDWKRT